MVLVLRSGRFTLYLIVMTGFYFLYNQVYNVFPLYVKRVVESNPAMDLYTAANPFVIVCFQLIISSTWGKMKPIRSMVAGTVIISVGDADQHRADLHGRRAAGASSPTGCRSRRCSSSLTVALIALGELFTSPRMYEYIGALSPKGQEGLFLGYANLPLAFGAILGGPAGAYIFNDDHGQGRDRQAGRPARTGARQQRARLADPDGDRPGLGRRRCGCSTGGWRSSRPRRFRS